MRKFLNLLATLFTCSLAATEWEVEDGVLVLTQDTFIEALETHEYLLVEFFATWCSACKKLAPEYAMAAQILNSKEGAPHYLAKIDVDKAKSLQEKLGVTSYPTLIWFV